MKFSEPYNELAKALLKAREQMAAPKKNCQNKFIGNKYADLDAVCDASIPQLSRNGIAVNQAVEDDDAGRIVCTTRLTHGESGQWCETTLRLKPQKQEKGQGWMESHDPQTVASAGSYGRRYTLSAILALTSDSDDDGNAASGRTKDDRRTKPGESPDDDLPPDRHRVEPAKPSAIDRLKLDIAKASGKLDTLGEIKVKWDNAKLKPETKKAGDDLIALAIKANNPEVAAQPDYYKHVCGECVSRHGDPARLDQLERSIIDRHARGEIDEALLERCVAAVHVERERSENKQQEPAHA